MGPSTIPPIRSDGCSSTSSPWLPSSSPISFGCAREGMKIAKAKGHLRGKQPKLNHRQEAHLVALLESGEYTTAELADLFNVARSTVYRAVERERVLKASAPPTSTPRGEN